MVGTVETSGEFCIATAAILWLEKTLQSHVLHDQEKVNEVYFNSKSSFMLVPARETIVSIRFIS